MISASIFLNKVGGRRAQALDICCFQTLWIDSHSYTWVGLNRLIGSELIVPAGLVSCSHKVDNSFVGCSQCGSRSRLLHTLAASAASSAQALDIVSSLAHSSSVFLAIQLLTLNELCLLCWLTHVVNTRLWFSAMARLGYVGSNPDKGKEKKIKQVQTACDQGDRRSIGHLLVCCGSPDGTILYGWVDRVENQNNGIGRSDKREQHAHYFSLLLDNTSIWP
jgi:hypothetical protein